MKYFKKAADQVMVGHSALTKRIGTLLYVVSVLKGNYMTLCDTLCW